jgi:hypothetical protein
MSAYPDWLSLRELDHRAGTAKGAAFRCFKALEAGLHEGADYRLLRPERDREVIDQLRDSGRIYASSVNVVLLAPAAAQRLLDTLACTPQTGR